MLHNGKEFHEVTLNDEQAYAYKKWRSAEAIAVQCREAFEALMSDGLPDDEMMSFLYRFGKVWVTHHLKRSSSVYNKPGPMTTEQYIARRKELARISDEARLSGNSTTKKVTTRNTPQSELEGLYVATLERFGSRFQRSFFQATIRREYPHLLPIFDKVVPE